MRAPRTILGLVLVLIAIPLLLLGGLGWAVLQHRGADGGFGATLEPLSTNGYAVVVPDLGGLVQRQGPAAWLGDARLRIAARAADGTPLLVGAAPAADIAGYLADVPRSEVDGIGAAKGVLPVRVSARDGTRAPALPGPWPTASDTLDIAVPDPTAAPTALVIMRIDGRPGIAATVRATLYPGGLNSTTWTLLLGGSLALLLGAAALWPPRRREVVLVVEPDRVDELVATLSSGRVRARRALPPAQAALPVTLADLFDDGVEEHAPAPPAQRPPLALPAGLPALPAEIVRSVVLPAAPVSPAPAAAGSTAAGSAAAGSAPAARKGGSHRAASTGLLRRRRSP